jgi:hypothetical protein
MKEMIMKQYTADQLLANEVEQAFRQFVVMPNEQSYTVSTLWVMHTHLRKADGTFLPYITPRLYYGSKLPGAGKSLALKIATRLSHNGKLVVNPTSSGVITLINQKSATIGQDEIDLYFNGRGTNRAEMRTVLNEGYEKGATIPRQVNYDADEQNIHGAYALAGKNADAFLSAESFDTLRSRSIAIIMERKSGDAYVLDYDPEVHNPRLDGLMSELSEWGRSYGRHIVGIDVSEVIPKEITNRDRSIWTVLFRIAEYLGGEWPARAADAARAFVLGEWKNEVPIVSPSQELLNSVRSVFTPEEDFVSTFEILFRLGQLDDRPSIMREWKTQRAAEMGMSFAFRVHGIASERHLIDGAQHTGYSREELGIPRPVELPV